MDFFSDDTAEFDDDNVMRDDDEECEEGEEGAAHDDVAHDDGVAEEDPSISPVEQARPSGTGKDAWEALTVSHVYPTVCVSAR